MILFAISQQTIIPDSQTTFCLCSVAVLASRTPAGTIAGTAENSELAGAARKSGSQSGV
jgi:hypothetical protein